MRCKEVRNAMKILVDADGCPVVDLCIREAAARGIEVLLICDTAHLLQRAGAQTIVVEKGADSADFALVNRVQQGDVVVTQDYGLAAMCLARKAIPIRQDGLRYDADNMDALLMARHTARKIRRGGGRLKGPKKRTAQEDSAFLAALRAILDQRL